MPLSKGNLNYLANRIVDVSSLAMEQIIMWVDILKIIHLKYDQFAPQLLEAWKSTLPQVFLSKDNKEVCWD